MYFFFPNHIYVQYIIIIVPDTYVATVPFWKKKGYGPRGGLRSDAVHGLQHTPQIFTAGFDPIVPRLLGCSLFSNRKCPGDCAVASTQAVWYATPMRDGQNWGFFWCMWNRLGKLRDLGLNTDVVLFFPTTSGSAISGVLHVPVADFTRAESQRSGVGAI